MVLRGMPLPTSHVFIVPSSPTSDHQDSKTGGLIMYSSSLPARHRTTRTLKLAGSFSGNTPATPRLTPLASSGSRTQPNAKTIDRHVYELLDTFGYTDRLA